MKNRKKILTLSTDSQLGVKKIQGNITSLKFLNDSAQGKPR